jgi:pyruvate dehydrogenase E1 component
MYQEQEDVFYYVTVANENYLQPGAPEHLSREELEEGVLKGLYLFRKSAKKRAKLQAQLFGSGTIMNEVLKAAAILEDEYGVAADVWSVTSYKELHRDALQVERYNRLNPDKKARTSYAADKLRNAKGVFVAASDYMKILPDSLARHLPRPMVSLGTDGYGRSEARAELRHFFEVDASNIAFATLTALAEEGKVDKATLLRARESLGINPDKANPYVD